MTYSQSISCKLEIVQILQKKRVFILKVNFQKVSGDPWPIVRRPLLGSRPTGWEPPGASSHGGMEANASIFGLGGFFLGLGMWKFHSGGDFSMTQGGCLHDPGGIDAPGNRCLMRSCQDLEIGTVLAGPYEILADLGQIFILEQSWQDLMRYWQDLGNISKLEPSWQDLIRSWQDLNKILKQFWQDLMQERIQGVQWVQLHPLAISKKFKINNKNFYFLFTLVSIINHHSKHMRCKIKAGPDPRDGVQLIHHHAKHIGCKIKAEPGP